MVGVWDFFVINYGGGEGIWGLHQRGADEQQVPSGSSEIIEQQGQRGLRVGLQEMATFAEHRAEEAVRQGRASHALQNGCEFLEVG
ncbi:hypothetical protein PVL29_027152 [Vitis rotundifolia]|uniref:Uncharacterized protein n=1 Tax=Vitis rotundifolia TaxID=103349 RepID=A0AA38YIG9_VITRO|nr:hypothetical protein PVL29_027152 [Vitis rotundifolia]